MRQNIIIGNWKMNGQLAQINELVHELRVNIPRLPGIDIAVLPPTIYLSHVQKILQDSVIKWGAQNVYPKNAGAYTGEVSGPMLQDYKCKYVLVGHSERRCLFHEDEKFIAEKFHHVKDHGMIPVLCIGETLAERDAGLTEQVLISQLRAVTTNSPDVFKNCVVAYEPVWAIGTGHTAAPKQVQAVHKSVREWVANIDASSAQRLPILYGGSVNENNAQALFAMPDIDGGLIGGASLNARQFVEIVKCINYY